LSDRRRNLFILLTVLGLIAGSLVVVLSKPTRLGLDLKGGVQIVYQGKPTPQEPTVTQESLDRAVELMRERVDAFGVAEPELNRSGRDQIEVNLPGVENAERAEEQIGTTAQMYFYDWEPNILDEDCRTNETQVNGGQDAVTGLYQAVKRASKCTGNADGNDTNTGALFYAFNEISKKPFNGGVPGDNRADVTEDLPAADKERVEVLSVPKGVIVVRADRQNPDAPKPDSWWVLKDNPVLSGEDIRNPEQNFDQQGGNEPIVTMEFSDEGRRSFAETTRQIAQRGSDNALPGGDSQSQSHHFAIRLDQDLISVPFIDYRENPDGIDGTNGAQISGGFTITSAQDLAKLLKIGALPIKLEAISRSQVSATLGQQALDQGLVAGIAGFAIVALFLILLYRVLGLIAVAALAIYALYFFALIKLIPITMTLPGIAGLILTIGVAADANIVIFERVKEEVRAGRSIAAGIANGYKKGFATIIDANIVTLLVAFILFIMATAGVKGFAFTLGVGTLVSLFTAVLATQAILLSLRGSRLLSGRQALGAGEQRFTWKFDFMGKSKWFFSASGLILLICAFAIAGNGLNFGIDFESGTRVTAPLAQEVNVDDVRNALPAEYRDSKIQTLENPELGANVVQVSSEASGNAVDEITNALEDEFGFQANRNANQEVIGPTFGRSVANSALIAIIASLIVISIYMTLRFEWKFAVPVLIALAHDILITAGIYALLGREVTTSTVAALLTILGFSLYDTIIVFDRIRENLPRMPAAAFSQIVNRSMSEVLTRSLATSFCTGLPVLALMLFGGDTLKDFAFALLVGTLSGTYSSVFIAGQVLTHWKSRERVFRTRARRILDQLGHIPAYAVATQGGPIDMEPDARARGRRERSLTAPQDPSKGVSQSEFQDLVKDLGLDTHDDIAEPSRVPGPRRPAGGRRAAAKKDGEDKPKKPRNRRHGRPR
jgi:SecD/SecF fusion protein